LIAAYPATRPELILLGIRGVLIEQRLETKHPFVKAGKRTVVGGAKKSKKGTPQGGG